MADKKKSNVHSMRPTKSFDQMMSEAQLKALHPYISQEVTNAGRQILIQISNLVLQQLSEMKVRSFAVENILKAKLNLTDEDVANAISDEEDKLMGYVEAVDGAKEGDLVRLEMQTVENGNPVDGKMAIKSLGTVGPEGKVQTFSELEADIMGKVVGNSNKVVLTQGTYAYVIKRVSRKVSDAQDSQQ